jgi:NADH dehydrogenase
LAAVLLSPGRPEVFRQVNANGTRNLIAAAEIAGVSHFIYVSSISVAYPRGNAYARSKAQGEEYVKASKLAWTIVRPTLAYEDGGAAEFIAFLAHLKKGRSVWLPQGGRARKNPVYVEDLAAGFAALPGNAIAYGKTYVFSGGEALTLREMAELLLAHMGGPKPVRSLPAWLCLAAVGLAWMVSLVTRRPPFFTWQTYTGLIQDADFAPDLARSDLGYAPRPFRAGVANLNSLRDCLRPK